LLACYQDVTGLKLIFSADLSVPLAQTGAFAMPDQLFFTATLVAPLVIFSLALLAVTRLDQKSCKPLVVSNLKSPQQHFATVIDCSSWLQKRVGLLNHSSLAPGHGIILEGIKEIDLSAWSFAVELIFTDSKKMVLKIVADTDSDILEAEEGRQVVVCPQKARFALILGVNSVPETLKLDDQLLWQPLKEALH